MKIFNWVHKRFHYNTTKDGFASYMKNTEPTTNNADSQVLLKQVPFTDLHGGWEDSILTIGTFGYGPMKSINHNNEYFALETEQGESKGEDDGNCYNNNAEMEELNPLMHNIISEQNFEDVVVSANHDANKEEMVISTFTEIVVSSPVNSNEIMESNNDDESNKGERITLADLFVADSDVKMKLDPSKFFLESSEKTSLKAKHGVFFAKKLIPNPRPKKDIQKLMRRMLKRKIHPDNLDVKNHKPEGHEMSPSEIIDDHMNECNNDSTYLLPI